MKKNVSRPSREIGTRIAVPVLFAVLCVLTFFTVTSIGGISRTSERSFDFDGLTNEARREDADVSDYLLPEFIGVTVKGSRTGVSVSANIVSELYHLLLPTLRNAFSSEAPADSVVWEEYTAAENSVYIKYHTELPDGILHLFAEMEETDRDTSVRWNGNVREIFILLSASASEDARMAVRNDAGDVCIYTIPSYKASITTGELERFVRSYSSGMQSFLFNEGKYETLGWTEPIYEGELQIRKLIMTDGTAALIQNSTAEYDAVLRAFGLNPDKLLNVHIEKDGSGSYYDTHGILYLRNSSIEYVSSSADGGRSVSRILGRTSSVSGSAEQLLKDYLQTALLLYESITEINSLYSGGEADLLLHSVTSENGEVTFRFLYAVNNIRISDSRDAYRVTFANGRLRSAELHTMAVRILAERETPYREWWFASQLGQYASDVRLVYRSDYVSESVAAEWAAEQRRYDESEGRDPHGK